MGSSNLLDDAEIPIPCPKCGRKTKKRIGWIQTNSNFTCVCGTRITLEANQFRREIDKVNNAFGDLQRTLKPKK